MIRQSYKSPFELPPGTDCVRIAGFHCTEKKKPHYNNALRNYNYFLSTFQAGIKYYLKIAETKAMKPFKVKALGSGIFPGCKHLKLGTDEMLECLAKNFAFSTFHFTGTCKMGNSTDKFAVVDNQLRVYGIKGLRVADASIMPTLPGAHLTAVCMMIGEKASDLIKETWK